MDNKQARIVHIADATEREILDRIVNAMLAAKRELRDASVQEWTRVLTRSCRLQRRATHQSLAIATTC